eukprot:TRINITY_DN5960_c0_g1_i1.p1 TRINITY_DN5960_c0_g1~~TRINITY_DN5960_c0_g1_i1.p1  ORF type:complete len:694 (+),score=338.70 TRINITY_DN5960_c0_g1_i1:96-2177(+)
MSQPPKDSAEVLADKNMKLCGVLNEKRSEIEELRLQVQSSAAVKDQYVDMLGSAERCWSQLESQLQLALTRLEGSGAIDSSAELSGNTFLAALQAAWQASDSAAATLDQKLSTQSHKISGLALQLFQAAEKCNSTAPSAEAQDAVQAKLADATMQIALFKERADVAETKLMHKDKEFQDCAAQLHVAKRCQSLLHEECEMLKAHTPVPQEPVQAAPAEKASKEADEQQPISMALQAELVEVKAEAEARAQLIEDLNSSLSSCKNQLKEQQCTQVEVSDEEVQRHPEFIHLNMRLQRVMQELQAARSEIERLSWDKDNMEAMHMVQIEQAKVHTLEQQTKSDAEFEKLREQNTQLSADVDALKRQLEQKEVVPDLGPQLQEHQTLLQTVKAELERSNKATERQNALLVVAEKQAKAAQESNTDELVSQLNAKLEMKEQEVEDYLEEINEVAKAYEDLRTQNTRLLEQLRSKEEAKTHLIEEKIQAKRIEAMLRAQKEELQRKATTIAEEKQMCAAVQARLEEQLKNAQSKAANLLQTEQLSSKLADAHKMYTNDAMVLYSGTRAKLETKTKALELLKTQAKSDSDQLEVLRRESGKLGEKVHSLSKKLSYYHSHGGSSKRSGAEQELQDMKALYACKIDSNKMLGLDKFCVITKCYHVFSDAGLQHNLANRNRKCPACQQPFDRSDVKMIYIDF